MESSQQGKSLLCILHLSVNHLQLGSFIVRAPLMRSIQAITTKDYLAHMLLKDSWVQQTVLVLMCSYHAPPFLLQQSKTWKWKRSPFPQYQLTHTKLRQ